MIMMMIMVLGSAWQLFHYLLRRLILGGVRIELNDERQARMMSKAGRDCSPLPSPLPPFDDARDEYSYGYKVTS